MLVRLAFSVMIQVDADVLLIDEVLAVGDAAFQQKCFDEFARIRETGATVVLVTHDMSAVRRFCDRAMLLEQGNVVVIGEPEEVGQRYLELNFSAEARAAAATVTAEEGELIPTMEPTKEPEPEEAIRHGDEGAEIVEGWVEDEHGQRTGAVALGLCCSVCMRVEFHDTVTDPLFVFLLIDEQQRIYMDGGNFHLAGSGHYERGDCVVARMSFTAYMAPGRYHVTVGVARPGTGLLAMDRRDHFVGFVVTSTAQTSGMVVLPFEIDVRPTSERALR
jgi:hypothetical protein